MENIGGLSIMSICGCASAIGDITIVMCYILHSKLRNDIINVLFIDSLFDFVFIILDCTVFSYKTFFKDAGYSILCNISYCVNIISTLIPTFLYFVLNISIYYNIVLRTKNLRFKLQMIIASIISLVFSALLISLIKTEFKTDLGKCRLDKEEFTNKLAYLLILEIIPVYLVSLISIFVLIRSLTINNNNSVACTESQIDLSEKENSNGLLVNEVKSSVNQPATSVIFKSEGDYLKSLSFLLLNYSVVFTVYITIIIYKPYNNYEMNFYVDTVQSIIVYSCGFVNSIIFFLNKHVRTTINNWWNEKKPYNFN